ncbi:L-Aspartase-like protein [Xylaria intraflava]|nr:L-Aspartase-like protein [Xylaria intraflava]
MASLRGRVAYYYRARAFALDLERLREVEKHANRSPLPRLQSAGRDFVAETLQSPSMLMMHVSRWAEDLIIYSTAEFSFVCLADPYSTAFSLMPQKKKQDGLELLCGKSGRVFGHLMGFTTTLKRLPSTYNKPFQERWEIMLDGIKTVSDSAQIVTGILATMEFRPDGIRAALDTFMLATDIVDNLVRKGLPLRKTTHLWIHHRTLCDESTNERTHV